MRNFWQLFMLVLVAAPLNACAASAVHPVSFMVFGDPAELKADQTLDSAFQQSHPEIAVELIHIPDQADYRKRLGADLAVGTPADVVLINYRRYAGFAQKGALVPLQSYLFSAAEAWKIENGKLAYPVKGATLIGNGPDVLTRVSMVGNDLKLDSGIGTCGKDGQSVPVGVGQPSLLIDGLTVGGTKA